jgi:shikimate kinase
MQARGGEAVKRIPALVITGPVGAGKSTTMAAISEELDRRSVSHVAFDMDYLRWLHPSPDGDPFAAKVGYRNLAAIWLNMQVVPLRCVLIADVVESRSQFGDYLAAMPDTDVTVVRLNVPMSVILKRLEGRETDHTIEWYRHRAPELQRIMEREQVADIVIDTGERSATDVAVEILQRTGVV